MSIRQVLPTGEGVRHQRSCSPTRESRSGLRNQRRGREQAESWNQRSSIRYANRAARGNQKRPPRQFNPGGERFQNS